MEDTLIFADDGFFGLVKKHFQKEDRKSKKYLQTFRNICKKESLNLKHLFIYTAPPYQSSKPTDKEAFLMSRYQNMTKMLRKKKWATLREGRCQKIINREGKEEFSQKGFEVIIYTYFDRKRYSKFSTSNHLLKAASRQVKLRSEDFEDYKAKGENKTGNEDDMKRMEREISEKINRNAGVSMHRIYVKSEISNLSAYNIINFPLKFSNFVSLSNLEKAVINDSGLPCGILNQTTENIFSLENFEKSVKCQSLVINTLCSNFENSANLPLDKPFGFEIMSIPCCFRNISNRFFTFSSLRNLTERDAELDIVTTSQKIRCILKGCDNMFFSNARKILKYLINVHSSLKHFKNLPNHNSRTFKSRSTSTNLTICNNIFVNFNSHEESSSNGIFKPFCDNKGGKEKVRREMKEEKRYSEFFGKNLKPEKERLNILPLNSEGETVLNNANNAESTVFIKGGFILTSTIPAYLLGGNKSLLVKCLSKVTIILFSDFANEAICSSLVDGIGDITSNPSSFSNLTNKLGKFSSHNKKCLLEGGISFFMNNSRCIIQCREDSLSIELGKVVSKNFFNTDSCSKQFYYLPDHDSSSFESWLPMTNLAICNNIFVNLDSHELTNYAGIFKPFYKMEENKITEMKGNINCKIYSRLEKASDICLVDIPKPRSYNSFSYVQTLMFLNKQSAIKSSSFECLFNNSFALGIKEIYSLSGTKVILLNTRVQNVLNLFSESLDFDNISSLCSLNSSLSFKGANIFSLLSNKSLRISPPEISILNKTLESITIFIYIKPLFLKFLCMDNLTFSDSSFASSSVNLLLDIISSAIANSSLLTNSFTTLVRANSNSLLNSGDTSSLIVISSIDINIKIVYKKLSIAMPKEKYEKETYYGIK